MTDRAGPRHRRVSPGGTKLWHPSDFVTKSWRPRSGFGTLRPKNCCFFPTFTLWWKRAPKLGYIIVPGGRQGSAWSVIYKSLLVLCRKDPFYYIVCTGYTKKKLSSSANGHENFGMNWFESGWSHYKSWLIQLYKATNFT